MSVIRNETGEVRLAWRLLLVILLFVAAAVLLRLLPIGLFAASLVRGGISKEYALERAKDAIQDPIWSAVIGLLNGLMGILIVWFAVHVLERSTSTWEAMGLNWRRDSPILILLGALLALLLYIAYALVGCLLGTRASSLSTVLTGASVALLGQNLVLYLAMAFGEEVVFRGYVQTRLAARLGAIWGIVVTALLFVLLHQISYRLAPVTALSGTMLWITIGAMYHSSRSLYLVATFHGVMNTLANTLNSEVTDVSGMVVHALALFILIVVARRGLHRHHSSHP